MHERDLATHAGTTARAGTTPRGLVAALACHGVRARAATITTRTILRRLAAGKPTPILWGDWSEGGHWATVIGADPSRKTLLLADPAAPNGLRCHRISTLNRYWQATIHGRPYVRCGVLV